MPRIAYIILPNPPYQTIPIITTIIRTPPVIGGEMKPMVLVFKDCWFGDPSWFYGGSNWAPIMENGPYFDFDFSYKVNGRSLKKLYGELPSPTPDWELAACYITVPRYTPNIEVDLKVTETEIPRYTYTEYYDWGPPGPKWLKYDVEALDFKVDLLRVDTTAYRPQTEPFKWWKYTVPENSGAGIRINGDDDEGNNRPEDDLIKVSLEASMIPMPDGLEYVLTCSNDNIKVWGSPNKGTAISTTGNEAIAFDQSQRVVWVENPAGGDASLELQARTTEDETVVCEDEISFYSFKSVVIGLSGEVFLKGNPLNSGMFDIAESLYNGGYDVHYYDEDVVDSSGAGIAYDEIESAVQERDVTYVAIFGHSHGGGSTYDLAERLTGAGIGTISYTAYVDAVENDSWYDMDQEHKKPPGTAYHVNYYQEGSIEDGWLDGGSVPGANYELNLDDPIPTETHDTIDNESIVINGIISRLLQKVTNK